MKGKTAPRRAAAAILIWTAAIAAMGMGRRPPAMEKTAMTTSEWKGQQDGPEKAGSAVIADAESWEALWRRIGRPAPAVDFNASIAVAAFAGQRYTGGYDVAFDPPAGKGDDLVVRFHVSKPDGMVMQVLTRPWAVRVFPRPKGRVVVEAAPE